MMFNFNFHLPTKIIFGRPFHDTLLFELAGMSAGNILLVADPGIAQLGLISQLKDSLVQEGLAVSTFTSVTSNPTSDEVEAGVAIAHEFGRDSVVALGGGSPIDVAKGIALVLANGGTYADYQWGDKEIIHRSRPLIAIPTTAGTGSEVSKVAVVSNPENPFKKGVLSPLMFPHVAIIDPELTRTLPAQLTAATGMDAFIHALEAFVGRRANPFTDQLAQAAMGTARTHLPLAFADGDNMASREQMMLAALWGGMAMDHAGLGLIHALSGPLTTHLHLHHGLANALLLPAVLRFNLPAIPLARRGTLNELFGVEADAGEKALVVALTQFVRDLGLPTSLSQLNIPLDNIDWNVIAEETTRMVLIGNNPRPASLTDCRLILEEIA
jgi:alcohol dehydrogenase class IV